MCIIHAFLVLELSIDASNTKQFLIILTAPRYCLLNLVAVFGIAPFQYLCGAIKLLHQKENA